MISPKVPIVLAPDSRARMSFCSDVISSCRICLLTTDLTCRGVIAAAAAFAPSSSANFAAPSGRKPALSRNCFISLSRFSTKTARASSNLRMPACTGDSWIKVSVSPRHSFLMSAPRPLISSKMSARCLLILLLSFVNSELRFIMPSSRSSLVLLVSVTSLILSRIICLSRDSSASSLPRASASIAPASKLRRSCS